MSDSPATRNVYRAQLLGIATLAQNSLDLDDPADFWCRQGIRDAYAAALLVTGRLGDVTQAGADRIVQLLGEGITDLGVLMEATEPGPRDSRDLTWVGQVAFDRLAARHPGIDHDLGTRWGPRHDIRISHRLASNASTGLLYAYDRTWDEYAILDPAAHVDAVAPTFHAAVDVDPRLSLADLVSILRKNATMVEARPDSPGVRL